MRQEGCLCNIKAFTQDSPEIYIVKFLMKNFMKDFTSCRPVCRQTYDVIKHEIKDIWVYLYVIEEV